MSESQQPRPDQEARRKGLELRWPDPLRVAVSDLDTVTVMLTNVGDAVWTPDPDDHAFVHGHFLDEAGQSPARCQFAYGRHEGEWKDVSLGLGESLELRVNFGHDRSPEPGSYGIEAILVSLNLRSPKATLEVVPDPPPRRSRDIVPTKASAALIQRLAILEALEKAIDNPQAVIELALESDTHTDFLLSAMAAFDIDFAQAVAISDMQVRGFFQEGRTRVRSDIRQVRRQLDEDRADDLA